MSAPPRARPGTALLLDAVGTLLELREPVGETYARFGLQFDVARGPRQIEAAFGQALRSAPAELRVTPDGRALWRHVVAEATGCADPDYFEQMYGWYATAHAWRVRAGAQPCCVAVRARGMRTAVVSNWDVRLHAVLSALGADAWLDAVVISGEVGAEKPDPRIFRIAVDRLGVRVADALHVGDDPELDGDAARAAGLHAWVLGREVSDFDEVRRRLVGAAP